MPSSASRQKLPRSASKAKARGLQPPPSSARKPARKASPGAPERSTRVASKTVESRAAVVPSSAPAAQKPADAGERVDGPKQLWLMKTDPDYMASTFVFIVTIWIRGLRHCSIAPLQHCAIAALRHCSIAPLQHQFAS